MNCAGVKKNLVLLGLSVILVSVAPLTWALASTVNSTLAMPSGVGEASSAVESIDNASATDDDSSFTEDPDSMTDTDDDDDSYSNSNQDQASGDIDKD